MYEFISALVLIAVAAALFLLFRLLRFLLPKRRESVALMIFAIRKEVAVARMRSQFRNYKKGRITRDELDRLINEANSRDSRIQFSVKVTEKEVPDSTLE